VDGHVLYEMMMVAVFASYITHHSIVQRSHRQTTGTRSRQCWGQTCARGCVREVDEPL